MSRIVAIVLVGFALSSCDRSTPLGTPGSGVAKTETRTFGPLNQIELDGAGTLDVTISQPQSIVLTCDDNILPLIETRETDGRLVVRPTETIRDYHLAIKATVADIRYLELNGAAEATVQGVNNDGLKIESSGAATVTLAGKTNAIDIDLNGAGKVDADGLSARKAVVHIAGAGVAEVHAVEALDATIEGLGVVRYRGSPKITKTISGLGTLTKKE